MQLKTAKRIALIVLNSSVLWILIASAPAVILYGNRFLVPDHATDTISYHLFNGERGARNPLVPFLPTELYPVGVANLAPQYDTLNYLARSLLGYRLGTILSLLAAIGVVILLFKLLQLILHEQHRRFHAGWGLLLVNASILLELYFQIATYFVDIINAFFVLLTLYLVLRMMSKLKAKSLPSYTKWALVMLAMGFLIAFKLTNLPLVLPLLAILLWKLAKQRSKYSPKQLLVYLALPLLIIIPLSPALIANYKLSHNPIFPFYNSVFKSPYYSETNFGDTNFGGTTMTDKIFWPVASLRHQVRLGEPHHIYNDFKLVLYWATGLVLLLLVIARLIRLGEVQTMLLTYFMGVILVWGLLFGINRYIVSTLSLGGLLIAMLFGADTRSKRPLLKRILVITGLIILLGCSVEDYRLIKFNLAYDMSWRPTFLKNRELHRSQLKFLFQKQFELSPEAKSDLKKADILLNCHTNVAGLLGLLPGSSNKPVINIIADGLPVYATMANSPEYQRMVKNRLSSGNEKTTYQWVSVFSDKNIGPTHESCLNNIAARGGTVKSIQPIDSLLGYPDMKLFLASGGISL